jgi:uncharacterized coiled-coil protein SlyX
MANSITERLAELERRLAAAELKARKQEGTITALKANIKELGK